MVTNTNTNILTGDTSELIGPDMWASKSRGLQSLGHPARASVPEVILIVNDKVLKSRPF